MSVGTWKKIWNYFLELLYPMDTILHFRLTGLLTAQQVCEGIIEALELPCKGKETLFAVITGFEIGNKNKKKHTHSAIYTNLSRETTRERLKNYFNCNKTLYQLSTVTNIESNLSYVTKCGDIYYSPGFEELVKPVSDIIPWVFEQLDFQGRVKELDDRYMEEDMTDDNYIDTLLSLYADHGPKNLMLHQVRSHWLALFNRRNRISTRRVNTMNGFIEEQYYPRQVLVSQVKNFLDNKYG